jgi:xanthine dehydrogenase YagR molybdenum-binding subunit
VECLRVGASRFGWSARQAPGSRRDGDWLVGLGVASSTYPAYVMPGNTAIVSYAGHGHYRVCIGSADIGTGNWTVLTQIAADALGQPLRHVHVEIGDSDLPRATVAGGSAGTVSHGSAVVQAAEEFLRVHGRDPESGASVEVTTEGGGGDDAYAPHSYGAQFVEARVNVHTGEVRVPRMTGVFAPGRIINPRTARSQLVGGMVWGLSMGLFEHSVVDHRFGHVVTADLADYHVPAHADIGEIDVSWLDDEDLHANALGAKGIGEIGIVGTAAAVANAVHNATGIRLRDLPLTPDRVLMART